MAAAAVTTTNAVKATKGRGGGGRAGVARNNRGGSGRGKGGGNEKGDSSPGRRKGI